MVKKRVTSREVAEAAGVSRTTVSLVLNDIPHTGIPESTRRRVQRAATRLNYHPNITARQLASGRTRNLAFVIHQNARLAAADQFFPQFLQGLDNALRLNDYHVLFRPVDPTDDELGYAHLIYQGYVDGVLLSGPQLEEPEAVQLFEQNLPIVLTGRLPGYDLPYVDVDNHRGAWLATDHLIRLGHHRIGLITNAPLMYVASRERFRGYQDCLLAAGFDYDETLMREGQFTSGSGYKAMMSLLNLPDRPTAVFAASDVVALGAMSAIRQRGLSIPEDVAVLGFDDVPMAQFLEPPLTSIHVPAYELGRRAGELSLELISQERPVQTGFLLAPELIIRASCGANA